MSHPDFYGSIRCRRCGYIAFSEHPGHCEECGSVDEPWDDHCWQQHRDELQHRAWFQWLRWRRGLCSAPPPDRGWEQQGLGRWTREHALCGSVQIGAGTV